MNIDLSLPVPRHHWFRVFLSASGKCEPGHGWLYHGAVRRDAWRIGRIGFGVLRMPRRPEETKP